MRSKFVGIVSIFPDSFAALTSYGVVGRALQSDKVNLKIFNPRDYAKDKHKHVDETPYGGGEGMLMQYKPLKGAITEAIAKADEYGYKKPKVVFFSPQGMLFRHKIAQKYATEDAMILISGCYEGIDQRVISSYVDDEISIGDYVLSGGELAIMVFMNAIARLWEATLGNVNSSLFDSFSDDLLEEPQYTRPAEVTGTTKAKSPAPINTATPEETDPAMTDTDKLSVPKVLLSGNHKEIARWKRCQSLGRTWVKRPDLLAKQELSINDKKLLMEYMKFNQDS